jgi:hypothetical protein
MTNRSAGAHTPIEVSDSRRHNFFIVDNEIFQVYGPALGAAGLAVYCYLAFRSRSGSCRVLVDTVARDLGMGERTVREQLCRLDEEFHLVERRRSFGGASSYRLLDVKSIVTPFSLKRQDMPNCTKRQQVPDDSAPHAAESGTRCLHNKTLLKTTSETTTELDEQPVQPRLKNVIDSRFKETEKLIRYEYERVNGLACPWSAAEARNLSVFLKATPSWSTQQIAACIKNRFSSASPSDPPKKWIPSLPEYLHGPKIWNGTKPTRVDVKEIPSELFYQLDSDTSAMEASN